MSGIHRTKIDWADSTWNPVSGCLHGCEYCYAQNQARRFQPKPSEWPEPDTVKTAAHDPRCFIETKPTVLRDADGKYLRSTPYPRGFAPTMHTYKLDYLQSAKAPRRIFVGSMTDLFGEWVPDEWLAAIFRECAEAPQHVYMFLTKNPGRYYRLEKSGLLPEADNFWWGMSITKPNANFYAPKVGHTFISYEPMLEQVVKGDVPEAAEWIILGAETGRRRNKVVPDRRWVDYWKWERDHGGPAIFMKGSLADIWGDQLVQDYPEAMTAHIGKAGGK